MFGIVMNNIVRTSYNIISNVKYVETWSPKCRIVGEKGESFGWKDLSRYIKFLDNVSPTLLYRWPCVEHTVINNTIRRGLKFKRLYEFSVLLRLGRPVDISSKTWGDFEKKTTRNTRIPLVGRRALLCDETRWERVWNNNNTAGNDNIVRSGTL